MFCPIGPRLILFVPVKPPVAKLAHVVIVRQYGVELPLLNLTNQKKLLHRSKSLFYTETNTMNIKL